MAESKKFPAKRESKVKVVSEFIDRDDERGWAIWRDLEYYYEDDEGNMTRATGARVASFLRDEVAIDWLRFNGYNDEANEFERTIRGE